MNAISLLLLLRLWGRRSAAGRALPVYALAGAALLFIDRSWFWETGHAFSWAGTLTVILGPLAAGLTAYDVARQMTPTLREVVPTTVRGRVGFAGLVAAHALAAVAAWGLTSLVALLIAAGHGAGGAPSVWVTAHAITTLVAMVLGGAVAGTLFTPLVAAPLAATAGYLVPVLTHVFGVRGVLSAGGATYPMIGSVVNPEVAVRVLAVNVLVGLLAVVVVARRVGFARKSVPVAGILTGAALGVAFWVVGTVVPHLPPYLPSGSPVICVGEEAKVCGRAEGEAIYRIASQDLARIEPTLERSGIVLQERYDHHSFEDLDPRHGVFTFSPESIEGGRVGTWDIAMTVARPVGCSQYMADVPPDELLDGQGHLAEWVRALVYSDEVPAWVVENEETARTTYEALLECAPEKVPVWPEIPLWTGRR